MNYPLISEYIEAIKLAEDNFEELSYLRSVLGNDGEPVMSGGNFAVVFKMRDERDGKLYAVKCFTKDQEGREESYKLIADELEYVSSNYLTPIRYYENELFVDTNQSEEEEFPVLLMDWVEGKTLDVYIKDNINNQFALDILAYQFNKMASWLLTQPFAHGDLKPDNILVKADGLLVIVDYDGMFVPAMKGQKAREVGSPGFRHPSRTEEVFNEHIDDFSIASIALSLKAIALKPSLYNDYGGNDRLLFSELDFQDLSGSHCLSTLLSLLSDKEFAALYGVFMIAWAKNDLSLVSYRLLNIGKSSKEDLHEVVSSYIQGVDFVKTGKNAEAFQIFSALKRKGNKSRILGLNGLGYLYAYGLSVPKDERKAFTYFRQAAEKNWATSIFNLGICYEKGFGIEKSQEKANEFYHMAAEKNFGPAQALENFETSAYFSFRSSDLATINRDKQNEIISRFYL